jgi:hypothetical protein
VYNVDYLYVKRNHITSIYFYQYRCDKYESRGFPIYKYINNPHSNYTLNHINLIHEINHNNKNIL